MKPTHLAIAGIATVCLLSLPLFLTSRPNVTLSLPLIQIGLLSSMALAGILSARSGFYFDPPTRETTVRRRKRRP
ncbi:MAG: hypothetical protein JOZ43_01095 [Acidobacteriales bacterium]|nr:hypothetical protein [Terriglobales bacterium]